MSFKLNMKKTSYICTSILLVVLIVVLIINNNYFYKDTSHNTKNIILLKQSSPFSFGATPVRIIGKKKGIIGFFKHYKFNTSIANDGGRVTEDNIDISWSDDNNALIKLTGQEQLPEILKVVFDDGVSFK